MLIDPIGRPKEITKSTPAAKKEAAPEAKSMGMDGVSISQEAKSLSRKEKIESKIRAVPDVRVEKVREAKEKIAEGVYLQEAIAEKIAEKLAERIIKI
ncbi:flagellar biosynthesis anti-sigma factor FlgM [bacterium]|nr:flagellar biosynthesis anti-sigma factor FlgM [bacterium]MBU1152554.1 flagellar biosynthesis anti-sigma factor FlgM [bacterium]MBU1781903.1 flagellar biosynthesis anti-sigma factor FlgM [bacterium]MBU2600059.1 flagellar biosynthesis anti-sigma factor FlgM [bacterium]